MKVKHLLHCHLLVPAARLGATAADQPMPALKKLLDWSLAPEATPEGAEGWLCRQFGIERQRDWPVAALAALADGLDAATGCWFRADPIYVHLLRDRLVLTDETFSDLEPDEVAAMTDALNQHFSAEGLKFFAPRPNRWYLRLADTAAINTCSREDAVSADLQQHLPSGPDSPSWRQRLNEVQMLLHGHPANEAREQRGALPVNSIWLWGGGGLPQAVLPDYAGIWSDDVLLTGLAKAAGCPACHAPDSAGEWLARSATAGMHLIKPGATCDLERDWFKPLAAALKKGRLDGLTLHLTAPRLVRSISVPRTQCWKFWRRANPLEFDIHA